ncbi:serine threonine protein kinase [Seminavis robusta]|uniref:Serine threonine protein kinase n=1 Tax=Seminavis robusta TaxID=568900 RepID=A0A9N8HN49_9STRA|nr:serine threonine protein kinase [Seminavis robusta]|eukprot:Sro1179_g249590.1 serine threonine protein kinase (997) ;mRNA; f:8483-11751
MKQDGGPEDILFARASQRQILLDALEQVGSSANGRNLILISGDSGTGKTALACSLQLPVQAAGGHFLSGKFDQIQQKSQNVIANAIGQYASNKLLQDDELVQSLKQSLGRDTRCLVDMIPALAELFPQELDDDSDTRTNEWMQDMTTLQSRTRGAFLKFLSGICSPKRPLVLLLDDLQWASKGDYQIIRDLLTTTAEDLQGILLVGACRVVDGDHELARFIRDLSKTVSITDVVLSNISASDVQCYLVSVFPGMEPPDIDTLAKMVYHQTDGNFFFIKQFLANLLDQKLIKVHRDGMASLDKPRLEEQAKSDDVLHFIVANLRRLSPEIQSLLQSASCLGVNFGLNLLEYVVIPSNGIATMDLVESCAKKGILSLKSTFAASSTSLSTSEWGFAHDRLQQASYVLIPEESKEAFHLSLGRSLREKMSKIELEKHLLLVTSHLVHGARLINSQPEREEVAALCLRAGQKSASQCNFDDAGGFIDAGLSLLGESKWTGNYELSLRLVNAGAEICYVRVKFDRLEELATEVFRNARCFEDTIESHTTHIFALGSRYRLEEAIAEGVKVLDQLGEPLPDSFSLMAMRLEHYRTRRLLSKYTGRRLLDLPPMKDPKKLASMRILNLLYSYAFWSNDIRSTLITYRAIQMSLEYGLCAMTGVAFSFYAGYLCLFGEIDQGNNYGDIALRIIDRFHAKQWSGRVAITVNSFVKPWKNRLDELQPAMDSAYKLSFATGDTEYAMMGRALAVTYRFKTGVDLRTCYLASVEFREQLVHHEQNVVLTLFQPMLQAMANLYGKSENALVLTGSFMDEAKAIAAAKKDNNLLALGVLYLAKAITAFFLSEFEVAAECARLSGDLKKAWNMSAPMAFMQVFFEGMAHLVSGKPNIRGAKGCLRELRAFSRLAPTVLSFEINLLEAELAATKGKVNFALEKFEVAIAVAQRRGVTHEQAFACERAAAFMSKVGQSEKATQYLDEAVELYKSWGCDRKVKKIEKQKSSMQL